MVGCIVIANDWPSLNYRGVGRAAQGALREQALPCEEHHSPIIHPSSPHFRRPHVFHKRQECMGAQAVDDLSRLPADDNRPSDNGEIATPLKVNTGAHGGPTSHNNLAKDMLCHCKISGAGPIPLVPNRITQRLVVLRLLLSTQYILAGRQSSRRCRRYAAAAATPRKDVKVHRSRNATTY